MNDKQEVHCIIVSKHDAEKAIRILKKSGILATGFKIMRCNDVIKVPITGKSLPKEVEEDLTKEGVVFKESVDCFEPKTFIKTYKDLIKNMPRSVLDKLPTSYDIVGEIILIRIPEELRSYSHIIGNALLNFHKNVKGVYEILGETYGVERVTPLKLIAGHKVEKTIYVEHGIKFVVYVGKTYINPSLCFEHARIAKEVYDGEKVLDMFCGIGGFSLHIAYAKKVEVYATDINPYAIMALISSLKINKLRGKVYPILGDSSLIYSKFFRGVFDRVIMNLPAYSHSFLKHACKVLKEDGGIIHYYRFAESINEVIYEISRTINSVRRIAKFLNMRTVLEASPRKRLYVVDVYVM